MKILKCNVETTKKKFRENGENKFFSLSEKFVDEFIMVFRDNVHQNIILRSYLSV